MKTDRERAIEKLWQNSAHGAEWRDVSAAYDAGVAAERERMCVAIKAADDIASNADYMLDSDDCISVIRGTWALKA